MQDGARLFAGEPLRETAVPKNKKASCDDCFFRRNMLCALQLEGPCSTFRPADRNLAPARQLAFVFRTDRTTAAYAFPDASVHL
jgi:hypothetical protein